MDRLGYGVGERLLVIARTPRRRAVLRDIGLGDADLRRLVRRGVLRHHHGHYIDGRLDAHVATIACAQAAYPGSVVSHFSAARLAGLPTWTDRERPAVLPIDATWLTRPPEAKRNQRRPNIVVRRAGLTVADLSHHLWLPVTSGARTVLDLARHPAGTGGHRVRRPSGGVRLGVDRSGQIRGCRSARARPPGAVLRRLPLDDRAG
jgi:hypothetical protein